MLTAVSWLFTAVSWLLFMEVSCPGNWLPTADSGVPIDATEERNMQSVFVQNNSNSYPWDLEHILAAFVAAPEWIEKLINFTD